MHPDQQLWMPPEDFCDVTQDDFDPENNWIGAGGLQKHGSARGWFC